MTKNDLRYSFGPVPSRRLGQSLGINNIPAKSCTYSCVYCQVGRTRRKQSNRRDFYEPDDIFRDVQSRLSRAKEAGALIDYLTFVPDGEPTLDMHLGKEIDLLKTLGVPVGVITNGSLLWRPDVRLELSKADWISLKVDAVDEAVWRRINRPHKALPMSLNLEGMLAFANAFTGTLVTETMLVRGINDTALEAVAEFLHLLQPSVSYLSIPTRPPAENWVQGPDEATLCLAYQLFANKVKRAEYLIGYEGNAFASTGDIASDLLSITAVHPMRNEAVSALLSRSGSSWNVVEQLVAKGQLAKTTYAGHTYYSRKLGRDREVKT